MDASQWDIRYSSASAVWSPHANRTLMERCPTAPPGGRSLDLGCGEGGDTRWLAAHGWHATGVDFSAVAVDRARASCEGMPEPRPRYVAADLTDLAALRALSDDGLFELVTTSYLHPEPADRARTFAPLLGLLAEGGHLFVLSHHPDQFLAGPHDHDSDHPHATDPMPGGTGAAPERPEVAQDLDGGPGPSDSDGFGPSPARLLTPDDVLTALALGPQFEVITAETIRYTEPSGELRAVDSLVLVRRRRRADAW